MYKQKTKLYHCIMKLKVDIFNYVAFLPGALRFYLSLKIMNINNTLYR